MNLAGAVVAIALTITTQNVRVGMPPDHAHHDINQAAQNSSVVITQEMGLRRASRFAPSGWGTAHVAGLRQGDCATYWDRAVWRERSHWVRQISNAPFRAGTRYLLVTTLRHVQAPHVTLAAVCVHSITRSEHRRPVFIRAMGKVNATLQNLSVNHRYVVVGGDWNRIWSQRARFPGFRSVSPLRATGPKGGRVDYFEWSRHVGLRGERIIGNTFSDHNGVRMHLRLR